MLCHLCQEDYPDYENFKVHILKVHRCASEFYKDDSDTEDGCKKKSHDDSGVDENDGLELNEFSDQEESSNTSGSESRKPMKKKIPSIKICFRKGKRTSRRRSTRVKKYVYFNESSDDDARHDLENMKESEGEDDSLNASSPPADDDGFEINSMNTEMWLLRYKELCRNLEFPLPQRIFSMVTLVHRKMFQYLSNSSSPNEHLSAVLKVYEDLNNMICRQLSCVNEKL